jgi:ribosomal protein S18 acetylase RimI-like enzyme
MRHPDVPDLRIVLADPSHAATVHAMMRELATHEGSLAAATTSEARWRELLERDDVTVLLATVGDHPAGYVSAVRKLHLWSGHDIVALDDLFVRAAFRNTGVGEALMRSLARRSDLPIRWEVEEGNLAGQRFYVRLGARLRRKVVAWWEPGTTGPSVRPPDA